MLRTYYEFPEIDVGRYRVKGKKKLVVISGREMSKEAGGWQNKHLYYTHGFGAVVSPASRAPRTAPRYSRFGTFHRLPGATCRSTLAPGFTTGRRRTVTPS